MKLDLNEMANVTHKNNIDVGWWDDYNRPLTETLMMVISEVSEALEGARKNIIDDHLPHRKMYEVELADALIRLIDLGGRYGWSFREITPSVAWTHSIPTRLFLIVNDIILLRERSLDDNIYLSNFFYSKIISNIYECARLDNLDLEGAILEKLEYNKTRADHKRENRAKPGGKKF